MVKDNLIDLKELSVTRLAQESKQTRKQIISRRKSTPLAPIALKKLSADNILTELQNKFSGRQQEIANFIETEIKSRTKDLYRKAHFDTLTHLPNRAYFKDLIAQVLSRAKETNTSFTLLFLDLDGFKNVNDSFGHHIGDELLQHACARLVSSVRENDIIARLGGDELVILLTDSDNDIEAIKTVSKRIIDNISLPYYLDGNKVHISTSIGISIYPQDADTASNLMKNADKALYVAKHKGKKQFRFYANIAKNTDHDKPLVLKDLITAIKQNELFTCVQSQVCLATNNIIGANITPHWQYNNFNDSSWSNWKGLLKTSEHKKTINYWLFDTACFYLHQWQKLNSQFVVVVPIADLLLVKTNLAEDLTARLTKFKVPKNQLMLSISMAELNANMITALKELTAQNFQITLTDLGSNQLDLNLLTSLKIKGFYFNDPWLQQQLQKQQGRQWIQALIQMVKSLDVNIIATGINNKETYLQLKNWGCKIGQGSYWSAEIKSEEFKPNL
jgi:diguanylate cyclase (GGDEF)-like protein